ncbi:MAG: hypothetical protein AAF789_11835 [Bacteroidota bacterium]
MECKEKKRLITKVLQKPLSFSKADEIQAMNCFNFKDIRSLIKRIYDANEEILLEMSDAGRSGLAGFNRRSTKGRIKKYLKKIARGHRVNNEKFANKVILAEGDSWFQFPLLVNDIVDWLIKDKRNAIYSIAYAGDWVTNIIYDGGYISELPVHQPDAFLISGGGNDLLGNSRLAVMLELPQKLSVNPKDYVKKEFHSFLLTLKLMYRIMFGNIEKSGKYPNMKIITQGYDYPIPRRPRFIWKRPLNVILTRWIGSGKWLALPMDIVGIPDKSHGTEYKYLRKNIAKYLIDCFNEMFIDLTKDFPTVFHVDCRGIAKGEKDWFDEIHLRSKKFKDVSQTYAEIIHTKLGQHGKQVYQVDSR